MSDLETSQNLTVLSQDPDTRQPEESSLLKLHTQPGTRKIFRFDERAQIQGVAVRRDAILDVKQWLLDSVYDMILQVRLLCL